VGWLINLKQFAILDEIIFISQDKSYQNGKVWTQARGASTIIIIIIKWQDNMKDKR